MILRRFGHRGAVALLLGAVCGPAGAVSAETAATGSAGETGEAVIYRTTGEFGEPSFTDAAVQGARPVTVTGTTAGESAAAEQQRVEAARAEATARIDEMLRVANSLEEARLARAAAATERRASRPPPAPVVMTPEQPVVSYPYGYLDRRHAGPRPPWRPPRPPRPPGPEREPTLSAPLLWRDAAQDR